MNTRNNNENLKKWCIKEWKHIWRNTEPEADPEELQTFWERVAESMQYWIKVVKLLLCKKNRQILLSLEKFAALLDPRLRGGVNMNKRMKEKWTKEFVRRRVSIEFPVKKIPKRQKQRRLRKLDFRYKSWHEKTRKNINMSTHAIIFIRLCAA